jgi:hypothetical protein
VQSSSDDFAGGAARGAAPTCRQQSQAADAGVRKMIMTRPQMNKQTQ